MRVVGGSLRGRGLATPSHDGLRPTSDRVRESAFNILEHGIDGFDIAGLRVLDLFAGTGAMGIEALSRGAGYCQFVEEDADARGLIRQNIDTFSLTGVTRIFRRDATDLGPAGRHDRFGLVFCDPPYGKGLGEKALASAASGGWLADGAIVLLEEQEKAEIKLPSSYAEVDRRHWGKTQMVFARYR
jgi:16S rRNA (guanine966-N2)-methyltransferase